MTRRFDVRSLRGLRDAVLRKQEEARLQAERELEKERERRETERQAEIARKKEAEALREAERLATIAREKAAQALREDAMKAIKSIEEHAIIAALGGSRSIETRCELRLENEIKVYFKSHGMTFSRVRKLKGNLKRVLFMEEIINAIDIVAEITDPWESITPPNDCSLQGDILFESLERKIKQVKENLESFGEEEPEEDTINDFIEYKKLAINLITSSRDKIIEKEPRKEKEGTKNKLPDHLESLVKEIDKSIETLKKIEQGKVNVEWNLSWHAKDLTEFQVNESVNICNWICSTSGEGLFDNINKQLNQKAKSGESNLTIKLDELGIKRERWGENICQKLSIENTPIGIFPGSAKFLEKIIRLTKLRTKLTKTDDSEILNIYW